jgi:hypothetical protein
MSGGHFDYNQNRILYIIEDIERLFDGDVRYSPGTMVEFGEAIRALKIAYVFAQRIDWLVSGDDGEDTFHKRLKQELYELK